MFATLAFGILTCFFGVTMAAECSIHMGDVLLEYTVTRNYDDWQGKYGYYNIYQWKQNNLGPNKKIQIHIPGAKITYQHNREHMQQKVSCNILVARA